MELRRYGDVNAFAARVTPQFLEREAEATSSSASSMACSAASTTSPICCSSPARKATRSDASPSGRPHTASFCRQPYRELAPRQWRAGYLTATIPSPRSRACRPSRRSPLPSPPPGIEAAAQNWRYTARSSSTRSPNCAHRPRLPAAARGVQHPRIERYWSIGSPRSRSPPTPRPGSPPGAAAKHYTQEHSGSAELAPGELGPLGAGWHAARDRGPLRPNPVRDAHRSGLHAA